MNLLNTWPYGSWDMRENTDSSLKNYGKNGIFRELTAIESKILKKQLNAVEE